MKRLFAVGFVALATLCVLAMRSTKNVVAQTQAQTREFLPLQLEEQIPVPGVAGRLDHFTADAKRRRLFVSALGNNTLEATWTTSFRQDSFGD